MNANDLFILISCFMQISPELVTTAVTRGRNTDTGEIHSGELVVLDGHWRVTELGKRTAEVLVLKFKPTVLAIETRTPLLSHPGEDRPRIGAIELLVMCDLHPEGMRVLLEGFAVHAWKGIFSSLVGNGLGQAQMRTSGEMQYGVTGLGQRVCNVLARAVVPVAQAVRFTPVNIPEVQL
jgi:hypothetical protein